MAEPQNLCSGQKAEEALSLQSILSVFESDAHFSKFYFADNSSKECLANGSWSGPTDYYDCMCKVGAFIGYFSGPFLGIFWAYLDSKI